jgi:hypothetical protein
MSSNARRCAALVLTLLATGVPAAHASIPPGGDPGGDPGDGNKHHVHGCGRGGPRASTR